MSERRLQTTSALLDGHTSDLDDEVSPFSANFDEVLGDPEAHRAWQRYAFIGQVIRHQQSDCWQVDISAKVASAVAAETTVNVEKN